MVEDLGKIMPSGRDPVYIAAVVVIYRSHPALKGADILKPVKGS